VGLGSKKTPHPAAFGRIIARVPLTSIPFSATSWLAPTAAAAAAAVPMRSRVFISHLALPPPRRPIQPDVF
jgi:hypothetical protein